jgi:hypothetical protein
VWVACVASVLPAGSVALTSKVWTPAASPEYVSGLGQGAKAAPSRLHSKLLPASLLEKANVAVVSGVGSNGAESIVVSGVVTSTVQVDEAGVPSVLPASSVARTSKVCEPAAKPVRLSGDEHGDQAAPSS